MISVYARFDRFDPTKTTFLRKAFTAEVDKRFNTLQNLIKKAIIDQDCFGLISTYSYAPISKQFAFGTSEAKVEGFMRWLEQQEQDELLNIKTIPQVGEAINKRWTDKYIYDSYKRGVMRARQEMKKASYDIPAVTGIGGVDAGMTQPIHLDRLGVLYTRVYEDLKGITSQMDTQLSRVLTQGMIDGDNAKVITRKLLATIGGPVGDLGITDTVGRFIPAKRRAETLARTEVIRAHHKGMVQEMRNWGAEGVTVKAEWETAGYHVCPICANLEGQVFTLDEIENKIPVHPNCRCCAIPIRVETKPKAVRKSKATDEITSDPVASRIVNKTQAKRYLGYKKDYSNWLNTELNDDQLAVFQRYCQQGSGIYEPSPEELKMAKIVRYKLDDKLRQENSFIVGTMNVWQHDTWKRDAASWKIAASKIENTGEMIWPKSKIANSGTGIIDDATAYYQEHKKEIDDAYLKLRAFNQAYIERIKLKEKIKLYRGIDGPEGEEIANFLKQQEADEYVVENAPLTGFTTSLETAFKFGHKTGGVTVQVEFNPADIVIYKDLLSGVTGIYYDEEEFIILNGKHVITKDKLILPEVKKGV